MALPSVFCATSAFVKLKKAFTVCVPGGIRFEILSSITPPGQAHVKNDVASFY